MSNLLFEITSVFAINRISHIKENEKEFLFEVSLEKDFLVSKEEFLKTININSRDKLNIKLILEGDSQAIYESEKNNIEDFIVELNKFLILDSMVLSYEIHKFKENNKISIYQIDKFYEYLDTLNIISFFNVFEKLFSLETFFFICDELSIENNLLETESIKFLSCENISENSYRNLKPIEKGKNICYSNFTSKYNLIPNDFKIIKSSNIDSINQKFNLASQLFSIGFLYDITNISEDKFSFKLNGYKTISSEKTLKGINISSSSKYFDIFQWVYNGGNLSDKLGIARNIISLNLAEDLISLNSSTFDSIKSGYRVYEKENLKQYIDIRNKISDQLWEFQIKADKISENFVSDLKKNIFALVSFFASVIILKVISSKDKVMISEGTFLLVWGFLVVSYLILCYSNWEVIQQKNRFIKFYRNVKERYLDLLDSNDVDRILNNDKEYEENIFFIDKKIGNITLLWSSFIVTFTLILLILHFFNL